MLEALRFENVGPAPELNLELKPRMNFLVGDNGLGKSFLLEVAWWALTHTWAREMVRPDPSPLIPTISYRCRYASSSSESIEFTSTYDRNLEKWTTERARPPLPGLVIYAQADGAFCVRDPARNYWEELPAQVALGDLGQPPRRAAAYLFSASEIWAGNKWCEGLIRDWGSWQRERNPAFEALTKVLNVLSPSPHEPLLPGELRRLSLEDPKYYPTLSMPYGQDVILIHASAGMRRVVALAYLLVWTWQEHRAACNMRGSVPVREIVFLIDEIEAHLHPQWQRRIVPALLEVMQALTGATDIDVQLVVASHSPLVLASTESYFDSEQDAIWALDLVDRRVRLELSPWRRRGDANNWLSSSVFDLREPRSLESESALVSAREFIQEYRRARHPAPPEWVRENIERREHQEEKWAQQHREAREHNLRVLNENIDLIRSGEQRYLLSWLCNVASSHDNLTTISLEKLREDFGDALADATSAGLMACWREHRPPFAFEQVSRTIITGDVRIGLAGLYIAFDNGLDPATLDESEVDLAARYAVRELNGFPLWFENLAQAHPDQVMRALRPAVEADLCLLETEDHPELLASTFSLPQVLRLPLARAVLDVLERQEPSRCTILQDALNICRWLEGDDNSRFAAVCEERLFHAKEPDLAVAWWCAWVRLVPSQAIAYLDEFSTDAKPEDVDAIVEAIAASLGAWPHGTQDVGVLAGDTGSLEHLIPIVYGSIRPAEDQGFSRGARFIDARDRAEAFRNGVVELLTTSDRSDAAAALERLARDSRMQPQHEWLLECARRSRQSSPQAQPMSEGEAIAWMRRIEGAGLSEAGRALLSPLPNARSPRILLAIKHRFTIEHSSDHRDWHHGKRSGLSWDDLLAHRWVAICAGLQHVDLQRRAAQLRREGKVSFFIDIFTLAHFGNAGISLEHDEFIKWTKGGEQGFVFLGWEDYEIPNEKLLRRALKKLRDYVGLAHSRLSLIVSSRSDAQGLQSDRQAIKEFAQQTTKMLSVPLTGPDKLEPSTEPSAGFDIEPQVVDPQSGPERDVNIVVARPEPLGYTEMLQLAKERLDPEGASAFMAAVDVVGAHGLVWGVDEVEDLLDTWRARGKLGAPAQIIERSLSRLLGKSRLNESPDSSLTWADCCEGFARLLTVAVLSGRHSFTYTDEQSESLDEQSESLDEQQSESLDEQSESHAVHPLEVLDPWRPSMVSELMSRFVFEASSSGHIYLSQPRACAYMAATWLEDRRQRGIAERGLYGLFFLEVSGKAIVPNHLAETLAWCSLRNPEILARTIETDPAVLLRYGDQTSLAEEDRERILTAYLEQPYRSDIWRMSFSASALRQFSLGLDNSVERHLSRERLSPASVEFLLELAAAGELRTCLAHALAWARKTDADSHLRRRAFRAVRALADLDQQRKLVEELTQLDERWDQDLAGEFASLFYPTALGTKSLLGLLRQVVPGSETHGSAIHSFLYYELVRKCPASERTHLLEALTSLFGKVSPDLESQLVVALQGLVALIVEGMSFQDEPSPVLQQALTRLDEATEAHHRRDKLPPVLATRPRVQRWLFWCRTYAVKSQIGGWPRSDYDLRLITARSQLVATDAVWLAQDANSHEFAEAREHAFRTLLFLGQEHPEFAVPVSELSASDPSFAKIVHSNLPLHQRLLKQADVIDKDLRASLGETDPFLLRWSAFMSELEGTE